MISSLGRYGRLLAPSELPHTAQLAFDKLTKRKAHDFGLIRAAVEGKRCLEIGGPSATFRAGQLIPIYPYVGSLDNCVFSSSTVWHDADGDYVFDPAQAPGKNIISEGASIKVPDGSYDVIFGSHVLEHTANPLQMLLEWRRALADGGALLVLLPHRARTFDHRRPYTTFEHLRQDFENQVDETDQTHLAEILELHDLRLDPLAGTPEQFRARSLRNVENRCLHHHVFSPEVLVETLSFAGMRVQALSVERPTHIIALATKSDAADVSESNAAFCEPSAEWRKRDPFAKLG